ncbi:hypothetical protein [Companilactobacillus insicii]|uniref:hypothetical protein n=1 Tax=Companilactobacillus insicii TaxID=1732567 RepID=UPI000F784AD6|nr:hypothetical protein [Companilactobacillus insicii]
MKKKTIIGLIVSLFLLGFSSMHYSTVKAESVTQAGYYAEVTADPASLYSSTGSNLEESLPYRSTWKIGKILDETDGTELFRVGSDEYLSSRESFLYQKRPEVIEVSDSSGEVPVFDYNLKESSEVALKSNTYWYSDTVIYSSSGMPFARVATNEYVPFYEVTSESFTQVF